MFFCWGRAKILEILNEPTVKKHAHQSTKANHVNQNEDALPSKLHGAMIAWVAVMIVALFKKEQNDEDDNNDSELD